MFVGHLAVALAAKPRVPRVQLGWLMAAACLLDLLWPLFLLAGLETVSIVPGTTPINPLVFDSYPWSHSLLFTVGWGLVFAAALAGTRVIEGRAAFWTIVALVTSHWVLDWVSHLPDLPLWPGASSPKLGLGLWRSLRATFVVEGLLWVAGLALYLRQCPPRGRAGQVAFWSLVVVCTVMWVGGPFGPPPGSPRELAYFALVGWLVPAWAALADRCPRAT